MADRVAVAERTDGTIAHHFTVDVEEYFQVSALERQLPRTMWAALESRVAGNVSQLLELLAEADAGATFFILGWTAERQQRMVKEIARAGHEIASHGWDHRRVTEQRPEEFRDSVRRSKQLLEDLVGMHVSGFRAPNFSIVPGREWALDILLEEGYRYDSSLFPIWRPGYGYPSGGREPYWIDRPAGRIAEVPPATLRRCGINLPAAGGAYFRILPYALVRTALREFQARGVPGTFYIHPWELDPEQPRVRVRGLTKLRHYSGLPLMLERLQRLLAEFQFDTIAGTVASLQAA